jgi:hypothetical protein
MERPLLMGMTTKGYFHLFVPPSVNDMPIASNAVDIGEEFVDRIFELCNFLGITVCNHNTEFDQNIFSNQYRKDSLEQPLVRPTLLTWEKGAEKKENMSVRIFGCGSNQGLQEKRLNKTS